MKYLYLIKYIIQSMAVGILTIFGLMPVLDELYYDATYKYFTRIGDTEAAFRYYLKEREIYEKPYYCKTGFELKVEFKKSVIVLSEEDLKSKYPLDIIRGEFK